MGFWETILLLTVLTLNFVRGETPVKTEGDAGSDHDPWRESNQPKIFVDYLRKPLSGNCCSIFVRPFSFHVSFQCDQMVKLPFFQHLTIGNNENEPNSLTSFTTRLNI